MTLLDDVVAALRNRAWQRDCVGRAIASTPGGIPLVRREDLVLLKLYAGGPQDAWDIHQLLGLPDGDGLVMAVDGLVASLPDDAQALWQRVRAERPSD